MDVEMILKLDTTLAGKSIDALANEANSHALKAEGFAKTALYHAIAAGKALLAAKEKVSHGEWDTWLESNWTHSPRTARRFMRLAGADPQTLAESEDIDEAEKKLKQPRLFKPPTSKSANVGRFQAGQSSQDGHDDSSSATLGRFQAVKDGEDEESTPSASIDIAFPQGVAAENSDLAYLPVNGIDYEPETNFHLLDEEVVDMANTEAAYLTCWVDPNWQEWQRSRDEHAGYVTDVSRLAKMLQAIRPAVHPQNTMLFIGVPPKRVGWLEEAMQGGYKLEELVPCQGNSYTTGNYSVDYHFLAIFARGNRSLRHYLYRNTCHPLPIAANFIKSVSAGPMLKFGGLSVPGFDLGMYVP